MVTSPIVTSYEQKHNTLNHVPSRESHPALWYGSDHSKAWAAPDSAIPGRDTDAYYVPVADSG